MRNLIKLLYVLTNTDPKKDLSKRIEAYAKLVSLWGMRSLSVLDFYVGKENSSQQLLYYISNIDSCVEKAVKRMEKISKSINDSDFMKIETNVILREVKNRTVKGSRDFYKPLPPAESKIIRDHYESELDISVVGDDNCKVYNTAGTLIAIGYKRVVIGDYGAYVEFEPKHMKRNNIKQKWPGVPKRKVKYIWMESCDPTKTKIYWQQGVVGYANYIEGNYYVAPEDVYINYES